MRFKQLIVLALLPMLMLGCSDGQKQSNPGTAATTPPTPVADGAAPADPSATADPMQNKGIGPVSSLTLEPVDTKLAEEGEEMFKTKCAACHKMDKRRVGPGLGGVTTRRTPEWIMNMIMNPTEMIQKDPIAKQLLAEYSTQMADMKITEPEARAILEYLRTKEESNEKSSK